MERTGFPFFHLVASVLLFLMPAAGCSTGDGKPAPKSVPVSAEAAMQKNVPLQIKTIGNVEAYNSVQIKALVGGEVEGVYFREGQDVGKGDLLFKIDSRPYQTALKQAEAALAKSAAQAKNAEEQVKRYAVLVEKDYVPRDQYDQMRANAEALSAAVDADRANVENARLQLAYCTIRSPIRGRAGAVLVNAGNIVKANDAVMTTINQIVPVYVSFSIPEQNFASLKKYAAGRELKVEAMIPGDEQKPARGRLTFIDNAVNTATGTIKLKGTFENRDKRLWPGQFTDVVLVLTTERNRTVVPSQAVQTGQQGQYVYVIKPDLTVELRTITPERTYNDWTVIANGLEAGEKVVTEGQLRLTPGAKVEIKNPPADEGTSSKSEAPDPDKP